MTNAQQTQVDYMSKYNEYILLDIATLKAMVTARSHGTENVESATQEFLAAKLATYDVNGGPPAPPPAPAPKAPKKKIFDFDKKMEDLGEYFSRVWSNINWKRIVLLIFAIGAIVSLVGFSLFPSKVWNWVFIAFVTFNAAGEAFVVKGKTNKLVNILMNAFALLAYSQWNGSMMSFTFPMIIGALLVDMSILLNTPKLDIEQE